MTRRHAVTVRVPGARIAPTNKTLACSQTGLEKSGANSTIRDNNSAGSLSMRKTPFGEEVFLSLRCLPVLFQKPKWPKPSFGGVVFYGHSVSDWSLSNGIIF